MTDTVRTSSYLLSNEFQDGQPPGSITAQRVRDYIVSVVDGAMITPKSTGSNTARSLSTRFGDVINVLDWLTAGQPDGTTDNTAQLQAAITAAAGVAPVYFPKTIHKYITTSLSIPSNSHLVIDGTILGITGATGAAVLSSISTINVLIEGDGIIDGNSLLGSPPYFIGIQPYGVTNITIRGLTIQNTVGCGINMAVCTNGLVDDCYMTNNGNSNEIAGIAINRDYGLSYNCWFRNCRIDNVHDIGFAFYQGASHCGISNCIITNCGINPGIAVYTDGGPNTCDHITIDSNIIYNTEGGINTEVLNVAGTHSYISIIGNQIAATTFQAIFCEKVSHVNICNNMIDGSAGGVGGIQIGPAAASDFLISGNILTGLGSYAVFLPTGVANNVSIIGNHISNTHGAFNAGVLLTSTNTNTLIAGNNFFDDQGSPTSVYAVQGVAGSGCVIANNTTSNVPYPFGFVTLASDTILENFGSKVTVVTASGAITAASTDHTIIVNKTVGEATTVTLMAAPPTGQTVTIKDGKGNANNANIITIVPAAGTIDGLTSVTLTSAYAYLTLIYNGNAWNVIS